MGHLHEGVWAAVANRYHRETGQASPTLHEALIGWYYRVSKSESDGWMCSCHLLAVPPSCVPTCVWSGSAGMHGLPYTTRSPVVTHHSRLMSRTVSGDWSS